MPRKSTSGQADVLPKDDGGDSGVGESVVSDPLRLINAPSVWRDDDNYVEVCGNKHYLREFTLEERYLWRSIRDGSGLDKLVEDFDVLQREVKEIDENGLADALGKRAEVIDTRITELIEKTPLDKWDSKVEDEINKLVSQKEELNDKIEKLLSPKRKRLTEKSPELMEKLESIREAQGDIFLEFLWRLAQRDCGEERTLEQYRADAKGSDRLAAQEVVEEGNFTWEAHNLNRASRRQLLRSARSKS